MLFALFVITWYLLAFLLSFTLLAPISTKIAPLKAVGSCCINPSDVKSWSSFKYKYIANSRVAIRQRWKSSLPKGQFCAWSSVCMGLCLPQKAAWLVPALCHLKWPKTMLTIKAFFDSCVEASSGEINRGWRLFFLPPPPSSLTLHPRRKSQKCVRCRSFPLFLRVNLLQNWITTG